MSILVAEACEALVEVGASEQKAKAAASAIPIGGNLATKEDIAALQAKMSDFATKEAIAGLQAEMIGVRKDIDFLKLVVFRFLLPAQLLIVSLAVKAAFFPG